MRKEGEGKARDLLSFLFFFFFIPRLQFKLEKQKNIGNDEEDKLMWNDRSRISVKRLTILMNSLLNVLIISVIYPHQRIFF